MRSNDPVLVTQPNAPEHERSKSRSRQIDRAELSHNGRIASAFRAIVEAGRYVPEDKFFIEASIERGLLNADERKVAKRLLDQLDEHTQIDRGYRRATKGKKQ